MTAVLTPGAPTGASPTAGATAPTESAPRWQWIWRGRPDDPVWVRPALLTLLVGTGVLYIAGLGASGWANSYYSAAAQAGSQSWKAWFFGSFDSSNFISVDKSPASLWVMGLSARVFGVNAWSILVPQALEGVAAVALLYAAIRRWFGPVAALMAGAVLALSPAAALMFRFNNPDALLVLFLVAGAYSLTRALESGSTKWLLLAFSFVGFGFLAKMLQALLVVPAFGAVYLFAGPPKLGKRVWQLALGAVAMLVSAGWWIAAVQLTPASARPYIGGSQNNSLWNLMFGYNGFGRLTGDETGSVGGGTRGGGRWGATGLLRMFNNSFGGQISWLLPAALILLAAGLLFTLRAPRTDRTRAAFLLWGGWLFVTGVAFSLGQGIIHPYYTVALAPAIGALVGMGAVELWRRRDNLFARLFMAATVLVTVWWSVRLLDRASHWYPWLRPLIVVGGIGVTIAILAWRAAWSRASVALAVGAAVVLLAGPGAWAIATASQPHSGAIPSTGPSLASRTVAFRGGPRLPLNVRGFPIAPPGGLANRASPFNGRNNTGGRAFGAFGGGRQPFGPGTGAAPRAGGGTLSPPASGTSGGTPGGLLDASSPSDELSELLKAHAGDYRWVAATVGANSAAGYQLATDEPVMAIGGFNGTDPSPTLAQFKAFVANGDIHYFVGGRTIGGAGGSSSQIAVWVQTHFASTTLGAVRLYDLTAPQ